MKYAAISFNFDSLGWSFGFPKDYVDPCFTSLPERYFNLSERFNINYSIYIIGRDLLKEENRSAVRSWSKAGHEIGNHSWSHFVNLGSMKHKVIKYEILRSHNIIEKTIGKKPTGFISPAWNTSKTLMNVLIELGYTYDTSTFPSWLMIPGAVKSVYNKLGHDHAFRPLIRKDLLVNLFGYRNAFRTTGSLHQKEKDCNNENSILVLPQPTNGLRIACWHTLGFMFGWDFHFRLLKECLASSEVFYYLIHPADFLTKDDIDYSNPTFLDRIDYKLEYKMSKLEEAIKIIIDSGRKIVTMQELAEIKLREMNGA